MKKYQARKALSVLLTLLMLLGSIQVGLGVIAFAGEAEALPSTNSPTLSGEKVYTVTQDTTIQGTTSAPGLKIPANTTVIIDIAAGKTLTVKGANASTNSAGYAGILMSSGSTLIITGSGNLTVTGGNGGNGSNGVAGNSSDGGAGGKGGNGGAGGGAGIGGNGGAGGAGGNAASVGSKGGDADKWPDGANIIIASSVNYTGSNGSNSNTAGSAGAKGGSKGGGGGGGGGAGYGAFAIGAGGQGAGGGGGGNKGVSGCSGKNGMGGKGGTGAKNGTQGNPTSGGDGTAQNGGAAGTAGSAKAPTRANPFDAMATAINNNTAYYGKTMVELVATAVATLESVKSAIETPYNSLIASYGSDVYNYYFGDYDTETLIANLTAAIAMQDNIALAQWLQAKAADVVDYEDSYANLNTIWSEFNEKYEIFSALSEDTRDFLADEGYIDVSAVEAKLAEYKYAMDVADLRENYYDLITGDVATYSAWDLDWVAETDNATALLSAAQIAVESYGSTLNSLDQNAVAIVFGEDYVTEVLEPLYVSLLELLVGSEKKDQFAEYKSVYETALAPVDLAADAEVLYNKLTEYDNWYTDLRNFIAALREFDEDFAEKVFNDLDNVMQAKIDSIYTTLNARVTADIDTAYDFYQGFVAVYGYTIDTSDDINVQNYTALRQAFNNIKSAHYNFLLNSNNFNVPQETVDRYELIKRALLAFEYYDASKGLSAYEFNTRVPVEDITRVVNEYDVIRDQDYTVDAEKRATAYENVKTLLNSDLVKGLLGGDDEEGGFDLSSLGEGLLDKIYTDDLVNTLVQFVYPVVVVEFAKVWSDLPNPAHVDDPVSVDLTMNYKGMDEALGNLGLNVLPKQLGNVQVLKTNYPENAAILRAITTAPAYNKATEQMTADPWKDPSIFDAENEKLTLEWGVHDRESFVNAMEAALAGVEPLLTALLSNKTFHKENVLIATGSGRYIIVNIDVDQVNLSMEFAGNPGYNNALAPILNVLGATNLPDGNTLDTVRKIADQGLAAPLEEIVSKLSADPIDFILKVLPNLAYAVNFNLIMPLLDELKTKIVYWADAHYVPSMCVDPGWSNNINGYKDTPIDINLGTMLDLESMGLDLSSASGLVNTILGLLAGDEEAEEGTEPVDPDAGEGEEESGGILDLLNVLPIDDLFQNLALWGDYVVWNEGHRTVTPYFNPDDPTELIDDLPYIFATPSEVFAHLVDYIFDLLKQDSTLLPTLVDTLGLDVDLEDEDSLIVAILNKIIDDPDPAIAAIVELMLPVSYNNWAQLETPATSFTYNEEEITPADVAYLKYANDWDKDVATEIATNVDTLIPAVANLLEKDVSLNTMLQDALNGLFTNANITTINNAIAGLFASDEDAEEGEDGGLDLLGLLKDLVGIDLSSFEVVAEDKNWGFDDGDKEGFVDALCDLLDPLSPLLKLMLPGEDLTALDGVVNINGYDVYPQSIALLFDALGVEQVTGYEEMTASEELAAILSNLLDWVDALTAEDNSMIEDILTLLPNLVYFIESNGLSVVIKNLLYPVLIVLDTIRPIYDVDILALLSGDGEESDGFAAILGALDFDNLKLSSILAIVDAKLGTDLVRSPLCTYAIPALTIKNGDLDAADVLTILLCGVIEALESKINDTDVTNGDVIIAMLDEKVQLGDKKISEIYTDLVPLITGSASEYEPTKINWSYMCGEIQLDSFEMPEYSNEAVKAYLSYSNNWSIELAEYVDDNLDDIVAKVLAAAGKDPTFLTDLLNDLINDNLYTADLLNMLGTKLEELLGNLEDLLKEVIDAVLGTEIKGWTYTPVATVNGKEDFVAKLNDMLSPFARILDFVLFGKEYKFFNGTTREDLIVLNGGDAYNAALVPVLEALGVTMPVYDGTASVDEMISTVLTAVTDRLDEITADPIDQILALLPNVLYFLNADGLKAVVNNAVAPFDGLVEAVTGNPIATLLDGVKIGAKEETGYAGMAINDMTTANLLELVAQLTGLVIPDAQRGAIASFYVGKAVKYDSANGKLAFKLEYDGDREDVITLVLSVLLDILAIKENENTFKGLLGEDIYPVVFDILHMEETPMKQIPWLFTEDANSSKTFSGMTTTVLFDKGYGPLFTQAMAADIADNIDDFVDDMIQLLGITSQKHTLEDGKEEFITSLDQLLDEYVGESIYTAANAQTVLGYIQNAANYVNTLQINGVDFSGLINDILRISIDVDLTKYNNMTVASFADGDRAAFTAAICDILEPIFPLLKWLLCDDDIAFFLDSEGNDRVKLLGAEGYRYGLGPVLEALDCQNIPSPEALSDQTDSDTFVKMILDPVFNRLDEIFANPADELFEILPNVAYFINSKGLDTCFKNLLNAVYTIFEAIRPVLPENISSQDIYGLVYDLLKLKDLGLENGLETIDMQWIVNKIVAAIAEGSSQDLDTVIFDAVAEMTTGKLISYDSMTGLPAYRMIYTEASKADTVTILLRFAINWLATKDNAEKLKVIVREKVELSEDGYKYTDDLIDLAIGYTKTNAGIDSTLHILYYIFTALRKGAASTTDWLTSYNAKVQLVKTSVDEASQRDRSLVALANLFDYFYQNFVDDNGSTGNVFSDDGLAPRGFIAFFRQIIEWIKAIFAKLKVF